MGRFNLLEHLQQLAGVSHLLTCGAETAAGSRGGLRAVSHRGFILQRGARETDRRTDSGREGELEVNRHCGVHNILKRYLPTEPSPTPNIDLLTKPIICT
ncbi:hypothetical protein JOB18_035498 [Solea senegalensis]|uniref:Uncharacterized protein n=1 Tax=Solea senegalensis TaxID=28829 RepID=A0AAV6PYS9_SOLSE|nr:hypothetical protein JOB18_035498 [Solea senegalensis]